MESAATKSNICQEADTGFVAPSQSTTPSQGLGGHGGRKKSVDYKAMNQNDILEDSQAHQNQSNLLIPEINFEAPTPKAESPNLSPKREAEEKYFPVKEFVLKYNEEPREKPALTIKQELDRALGVTSEDEKISEEDWERMAALAEEERLGNIGGENAGENKENNENRIKLNKFLEDPKVDIPKSRLAEELKLILTEATKRIEENNFPEAKLNKIKKKRKNKKEVSFAKKKSIINQKDRTLHDVREDDLIKEALMKAEMDITDITDNPIEDHDEDVDVEDSSLLNGFMEGFEEEISEPEDRNVFTSVNKCVLVTSALVILGLGSAIFLIHRLRR